jgi:hypothetical protein
MRFIKPSIERYIMNANALTGVLAVAAWSAITFHAGIVHAADKPSGSTREPLIFTVTSFTYGQSVTPVVVPALLAANGLPGHICVELGYEQHPNSEEFGVLGGYSNPKLPLFMIGKAKAEEAGPKYCREPGWGAGLHAQWVSRVAPYEGRVPAVLILQVDTPQYVWINEGRSHLKAIGWTVVSLRPMVTAAKAAGVRVLLYMDGGKAIDSSQGPKGQPRVAEDDDKLVPVLDTGAYRVARELGVEVIPHYRMVAALRRQPGEVPLHTWFDLSRHGRGPANYLTACMVATAIKGGLLTPCAEYTAIDAEIAKAYEGNRGELEREAKQASREVLPPAGPLTVEQVKHIHAMAWQAMQEFTDAMKKDDPWYP